MSHEYKPEERKNIQDVRPLWAMNATEQRLVSGGNDWEHGPCIIQHDSHDSSESHFRN